MPFGRLSELSMSWSAPDVLILNIPEKLSSCVWPVGILKGGSVNQIEPSDFTTTSLGLFSFFPSNPEASGVMSPFVSCLATLRSPICVRISLPPASKASPLELLDWLR